MFKEGDLVVCVKEPNVPDFIGTLWRVVLLRKGNYYNAIYAMPLTTSAIKAIGDHDTFSFYEDEVALATPLIKELV